jgi:hypothetical protein
MHAFDAVDGTRWSFTITYGTVKTVLDDTGLKLTDLFFDNAASAAILDDNFKLMEVMFSALKPQAAQLGKSFEDFLAGMDDTVLAKAVDALLEALTDFFREPRRTMVRRALERYRIASERLTTAGTLAVEKELDRIDFEQLIVRTHTSSASSSPASVG